jgi:hypothetical protein
MADIAAAPAPVAAAPAAPGSRWEGLLGRGHLLATPSIPSTCRKVENDDMHLHGGIGWVASVVVISFFIKRCV